MAMNISSTQFRRMLAPCLLVAAGGLLPKSFRAETRTAAALTPEAVGAEIDAANDGDTVILPARTAITALRSPALGCPLNSQFLRLPQRAGKRKNWLHLGSPEAGTKVAAIASLSKPAAAWTSTSAPI
jgi:hypothetical protein